MVTIQLVYFGTSVVADFGDCPTGAKVVEAAVRWEVKVKSMLAIDDKSADGMTFFCWSSAHPRRSFWHCEMATSFAARLLVTRRRVKSVVLRSLEAVEEEISTPVSDATLC